ncbi:flagellar basal body-associated protein FliL [Vibrio mangrovi]|uniref:Flagellar protein FliL n=1 Tax=Vibrio mangrovi TaxID=474394 RepID=A0A1Y6J0R0_9VIBR|nr:flagellar basal body-associated protein FliL [Vibrio mangrovi]MDW6002605.1 flagellar basal body-associated protein FliL [Vibrio mangrovi]SMS01863.1 flagellar basal body-associated protein FliL-like protein [Vibrio mangrovi]
MLKRYLALIIFMTGLLSASPGYTAEDAEAPKLAYFTLEPDLTTNFFTKGKELGYIQVRIEIMVASSADLSIIEKHQPLIRDTVVELMGKQTEDTVKSLAGREDLRKTLVKKINDLLLPETGRAIVADLLFTKYIYQ